MSFSAASVICVQNLPDCKEQLFHSKQKQEISATTVHPFFFFLFNTFVCPSARTALVCRSNPIVCLASVPSSPSETFLAAQGCSKLSLRAWFSHCHDQKLFGRYLKAARFLSDKKSIAWELSKMRANEGTYPASKAMVSSGQLVLPGTLQLYFPLAFPNMISNMKSV